jgi:transcription elongation factor Elf1
MADPEIADFTCMHCGAKYKVVRVETLSEAQELTCVSCGAPLEAREGQFALKYFLVE